MKKLIIYVLLAIAFATPKAQHYQLGTTTALWNNPGVEDFMDAKRSGFKYVEVALNQCYRGVPANEVVSRVHFLKNKIDSTGLKVWSIHLPFSRTLDISVLDDNEREKNVAFIAEMIELSAMFNPSRLVLHPSSEPISENIREQRIKNSIQSIDTLRKYANSINAQLCIENLPRTCLGNTPEELLRIVESFPDVGICFDTNHYLKGNPVDFVRKTGHRIKTLHVSDYDGDDERHWIPGDGSIDWGKLTHEIYQAGYDGVFMFETTKDVNNNRVSPAQLSDSFQMIINQLQERYLR